MSLNKVMLIGNVGRDPNVRYLEGNNPGSQGRKVATFTLATSERFRDRNGETRENTEWHNIVAWGQPADVCERFVHKGTQLYIEGRLRTRKYTDSQGVEKYTTEINVDTLQLLGRRDDGGYQGDQPGGGYQQPSQGYNNQGGYQQQGGYQRPAAPAQPVQSAPAVQDIPAGDDAGTDDLPF
ncbi:MAG: single-stranded DNA-binding protein [Bacteroidales bacterium]|nr:single-stranded DNA-binding protein [Bacteroidales bacterium]